MVCIDANDDNSMCSPNTHRSYVEWQSRDGTDYYIAVHGKFNESGEFSLQISPGAQTTRPPQEPTHQATLRPSRFPMSSPMMDSPTVTPSIMLLSPESKNSPVGAIVGGSIAALALVCATVFGVVYVRKKYGTEKAVSAAKPSSDDNNSSRENPQVEAVTGSVSSQTPIAMVVAQDNEQHAMATVLSPIASSNRENGPAFKDQVQTVIGQPMSKRPNRFGGLPSALGTFQPSTTILRTRDDSEERYQI